MCREKYKRETPLSTLVSQERGKLNTYNSLLFLCFDCKNLLVTFILFIMVIVFLCIFYWKPMTCLNFLSTLAEKFFKILYCVAWNSIFLFKSMLRWYSAKCINNHLKVKYFKYRFYILQKIKVNRILFYKLVDKSFLQSLIVF